MAKIRIRVAYIATTVMTMLFLSACGLKDDLYIPGEETPGEKTNAPSADTQITGDPGAEETNPDDENGGEAPDRLSEPAP
jgi:predicted small lipoprotein YifL